MTRHRFQALAMALALSVSGCTKVSLEIGSHAVVHDEGKDAGEFLRIELRTSKFAHVRVEVGQARADAMADAYGNAVVDVDLATVEHGARQALVRATGGALSAPAEAQFDFTRPLTLTATRSLFLGGCDLRCGGRKCSGHVGAETTASGLGVTFKDLPAGTRVRSGMVEATSSSGETRLDIDVMPYIAPLTLGQLMPPGTNTTKAKIELPITITFPDGIVLEAKPACDLTESQEYRGFKFRKALAEAFGKPTSVPIVARMPPSGNGSALIVSGETVRWTGKDVPLSEVGIVALTQLREAQTIACGNYRSFQGATWEEEPAAITIWNETVILYDPRTGKEKARKTFAGKLISCPERFTAGGNALDSSPDDATITRYIRDFAGGV